MRKSVFSILQTLVGPYSKPLLRPAPVPLAEGVPEKLVMEQTGNVKSVHKYRRVSAKEGEAASDFCNFLRNRFLEDDTSER